mgnify:CR=1 FL=1
MEVGKVGAVGVGGVLGFLGFAVGGVRLVAWVLCVCFLFPFGTRLSIRTIRNSRCVAVFPFGVPMEIMANALFFRSLCGLSVSCSPEDQSRKPHQYFLRGSLSALSFPKLPGDVKD